jgi:hypothetical protein
LVQSIEEILPLKRQRFRQEKEQLKQEKSCREKKKESLFQVLYREEGEIKSFKGN